MELGTEVLWRRLRVAFDLPNVAQARTYLESLVIRFSVPSRISTRKIAQNGFHGTWFSPRKFDSGGWIMYLHGGGYSFYPKAFYDTVAASFALSTNANVFALDYRLAPEHRYPAQLEDAIAAYKWLIRQTADPGRLVVIGDSAGGNLALALLLSLRESRLPLPALAICLSPATDFRIDTEGAPMNSEFDWIAEDMAMQWSDWFCSPAQRSDPLVSPVLADLKGLPPIYIQAGGAEMLLPRIEEFARRAKQQGADVTLETWPEMNHVFQAFGNDVPQSREALRRIVEVITVRMAHSLTHSAVP